MGVCALAYQCGDFAFGGCGLFATAYYVVQRTCQVRLFAMAAAFTFWGWQLVIVLAAISAAFGFTTGKEYAELEWPIDILITLVWVSFAIVFFFGTVGTRKIKHIYVANWFFGAFILAVAICTWSTAPRCLQDGWGPIRLTPVCGMPWCSGGMASKRRGILP